MFTWSSKDGLLVRTGIFHTWAYKAKHRFSTFSANSFQIDIQPVSFCLSTCKLLPLNASMKKILENTTSCQ